MSKKVFGLVGPIASGKGTIVKILVEKGYKSYSLSDRIREEITARGLEITRITLNHVSNDLRFTLGSEILAKRTVELINLDNPEFVIIDAIRNPQEVLYLKENLGAKIIGVTAPQEKRYEMFKNRGSNDAGIDSFEQFKELDDRETKGTDDHSQRVADSLAMADKLVENDGTIEELGDKISELLGTSD